MCVQNKTVLKKCAYILGVIYYGIFFYPNKIYYSRIKMAENIPALNILAHIINARFFELIPA